MTETAPRNGSTQAIIEISGMSCTNCAQRVEKNLKNLEGVDSVQVNFAVEKAYVEYNPNLIEEKKLVEEVEAAGYGARIAGEEVATTANFNIKGMTCANCAQGLEKRLQELPGIEEANVNFATEKAMVKYTPAAIGVAELKKIVRDSGYEVMEEEVGEAAKDQEIEKMAHAAKRMWFAVAFAAPIMVLMMIHMLVVEIP